MIYKGPKHAGPNIDSCYFPLKRYSLVSLLIMQLTQYDDLLNPWSTVRSPGGGMWVYGLDWAGPGYRQVADACECGNEPSGSVKCGEFLA